MWSRQEFLELVQRDPLTFGPALSEHAEELNAVLADDAQVVGFLVNLVHDDVTGERSEWLVHILTEATLVWIGVDRSGGADTKRYSSGAFSCVSSRAVGLDRSPNDSEALHWVRNRKVRCDFSVGGGYYLFEGPAWYAQWGGNVTDLAVQGATALFNGLPGLVS